MWCFPSRDWNLSSEIFSSGQEVPCLISKNRRLNQQIIGRVRKKVGIVPIERTENITYVITINPMVICGNVINLGIINPQEILICCWWNLDVSAGNFSFLLVTVVTSTICCWIQPSFTTADTTFLVFCGRGCEDATLALNLFWIGELLDPYPDQTCGESIGCATRIGIYCIF